MLNIQWLIALGGIILADIALSGDNALIIGAAAATLPKRQRRFAILLGGGGAIVLRIAFTLIATYLLLLPLLQAIGGIVLLYIAVKLLIDQIAHHHPEVHLQSKPKQSLFGALTTILIADVTMSLDNVLAIGGLAHGDFWVVTIGLIISILLLMVGSSLIATLTDKLPWLTDLACLVLGWTAGHMIVSDLHLSIYMHVIPYAEYVIPGALTLGILILDLFLRRRAQLRKRKHISDSPEPKDLSQVH